MSWKEVAAFFAVDKLLNAWKIVRQNGGLWRSLLMTYRTDTLKGGRLVGIDSSGNRYYENNGYFIGRNRWVVYNNKVWLNYDASQIPAEWFPWMHHQTDVPPTERKVEKRSWMMPHMENMSGTSEQFVPYSTTRTKIEAWEPSSKREKMS